MNYGPPKELLSDNGTNLLASVVEDHLRKLHARHRYTRAYHPRINEKVENLNGTLGEMLTMSQLRSRSLGSGLTGSYGCSKHELTIRGLKLMM